MGAEGDPSAGSALADGSSNAGAEFSGQSCVLGMAPSAVPEKAKGWTRSEVSSGDPTRSRMRQGWRHDCDLDLWSIQDTRLQITTSNVGLQSILDTGQGSCWRDPILWFGTIWRVLMSLGIPCIYTFICMGPQGEKNLTNCLFFPKANANRDS